MEVKFASTERDKNCKKIVRTLEAAKIWFRCEKFNLKTRNCDNELPGHNHRKNPRAITDEWGSMVERVACENLRKSEKNLLQ
jgi:hypothetical protein